MLMIRGPHGFRILEGFQGCAFVEVSATRNFTPRADPDGGRSTEEVLRLHAHLPLIQSNPHWSLVELRRGSIGESAGVLYLLGQGCTHLRGGGYGQKPVNPQATSQSSRDCYFKKVPGKVF